MSELDVLAYLIAAISFGAIFFGTLHLAEWLGDKWRSRPLSTDDEKGTA